MLTTALDHPADHILDRACQQAAEAIRHGRPDDARIVLACSLWVAEAIDAKGVRA